MHLLSFSMGLKKVQYRGQLFHFNGLCLPHQRKKSFMKEIFSKIVYCSICKKTILSQKAAEIKFYWYVVCEAEV